MRLCAFAVLALTLFAAGCATRIEESDVFRPSATADLKYNISDETGVVFADNVPRDGLWEDSGIAFMSSRIRTPTGRVHYQLARVRNSASPLIVYCGGASFDIPNHGDVIAYQLYRHGDVMLWDYPGYGESEGAPSVSMIRAGGEALLAQLDLYMRGPEQPLVFYGQGLGGFVCAEMAAAAGPRAAALVLEASAPSARASGALLRGGIEEDRVELARGLQSFDAVDAAAKTKAPVLVLSAGRDNLAPAALGREIEGKLSSAAVAVVYREFPDADHFGIPTQQDFHAVLADFLRDALSARTTTDGAN